MDYLLPVPPLSLSKLRNSFPAGRDMLGKSASLALKSWPMPFTSISNYGCRRFMSPASLIVCLASIWIQRKSAALRLMQQIITKGSTTLLSTDFAAANCFTLMKRRLVCRAWVGSCGSLRTWKKSPTNTRDPGGRLASNHAERLQGRFGFRLLRRLRCNPVPTAEVLDSPYPGL